jgi:hypothetical protein
VTPLVVPKRHAKATNIVSTKSTTNASARLTTIPGTHKEVSIEMALWSDVSSPSRDKAMPLPSPKEVPSMSHQPRVKAVTSDEQSVQRHLLIDKRARTLPKRMPGPSIQASASRPIKEESTLSHLPNDELRQSYQAVPRSTPSARDTHEAVIKGETGEIIHSCSVLTIHVLSQNSPLLKAQPTNKTEPFCRATENAKRSIECHNDCSERLFERSKTGQTSSCPGKVGEERRSYVADKINETNTAHGSPELPTALTQSSPMSASLTQMLLPRHLPKKPAWELEDEQYVYSAIIDKDKETSISKCSQESLVALLPHSPLPDGQVRTTSPYRSINKHELPVKGGLEQYAHDVNQSEKMSITECSHGDSVTGTSPLGQLKDEASLSTETAPRRRYGLPVVDVKHPMSDRHLPMDKATRKPEPMVSSREGEGLYLTQAAAYIKERLAKCFPQANRETLAL